MVTCEEANPRDATGAVVDQLGGWSTRKGVAQASASPHQAGRPVLEPGRVLVVLRRRLVSASGSAWLWCWVGAGPVGKMSSGTHATGHAEPGRPVGGPAPGGRSRCAIGPRPSWSGCWSGPLGRLQTWGIAAVALRSVGCLIALEELATLATSRVVADVDVAAGLWLVPDDLIYRQIH